MPIGRAIPMRESLPTITAGRPNPRDYRAMDAVGDDRADAAVERDVVAEIGGDKNPLAGGARMSP